MAMNTNGKGLGGRRFSAFSSVLKMFVVGVLPMLMLISCGDDEPEYVETPVEHQHSEEEVEAFPYLGYYACERGVTDFKLQKFTNDAVTCVGLKDGKLWFAVFSKSSLEQECEWVDTVPFDKEITFEAADGSRQGGTVESISVKRIKRVYTGADEIDCVIVLRYTLTDGREVFQPVFDIYSEAKAGLLPVVENLERLIWSLGDVIIVNDIMYNYDAVGIFRFADDFEKPQEKLENFQRMSYPADKSAIYSLESVKVRDNKCVYLEYVGKTIFWEYDFAPLFDGKEITAVKIDQVYADIDMQGHVDLEITAKDADGTKKKYELKLDMKDGSLMSFE